MYTDMIVNILIVLVLIYCACANQLFAIAVVLVTFSFLFVGGQRNYYCYYLMENALTFQQDCAPQTLLLLCDSIWMRNFLDKKFQKLKNMLQLNRE